MVADDAAGGYAKQVVVGGPNAAAGDHRPLGHRQEVPVEAKVGAVERAVAGDRGDEVARRAGVLQRDHRVLERRALLLPALDHDVTPAHIHGHQDPLGELLDGARHERGIERGTGPQDRAAGAQAHHLLDVLEGPHTAAHLHRDHDRGADLADRLAVVTVFERRVQIDHVQPPRALFLEADRDRNGVVGVIGTEATVATGAYQRAVGSTVELHAAACPLFVEHVERGDTTSPELRTAAAGYLAPLKERGIDTLILGCTHYPLLSGLLQLELGPDVVLVSSAEETAKDVYAELLRTDMQRGDGDPPRHEFLTTGEVAPFHELAERFLSRELAHVDTAHVTPGGPV